MENVLKLCKILNCHEQECRNKMPQNEDGNRPCVKQILVKDFFAHYLLEY